VERELRIPLRPVPSGSKLDIRVGEVRCHFEWKRASPWCDGRFEVNEVKDAEQGNVLTQWLLRNPGSELSRRAS
jgi:hypothetical protein